MQTKGLISVITPCYNTGGIVHRLLDSILVQDYPLVEMFAIDDGSTDNTKIVIAGYIPKFQERGYKLYYIYQENRGQSSAVNNGLKLINGEFLIWPDSDDFFASSEALTKMAKALEASSDEYGAVRCRSNYVDENTLLTLHTTPDDSYFRKELLFEDCLFSKNHFMWGAGNYMLKTSSLLTVNPQLEIYNEQKAGQNWQMLLPILYDYKCIPKNDILFNITERSNSHSRKSGDYDIMLDRINVYEKTILETLDRIKSIPYIQKSQYVSDVKRKYNLMRCDTFFSQKNFCRFVYNLHMTDMPFRLKIQYLMSKLNIALRRILRFRNPSSLKRC